MNRLRGLIMVQASDTEAVLGQMLRHLNRSANLQRPAGALLRDINQLLDSDFAEHWAFELDIVEQAIKRRNRVVHDRLDIGAVWREYATGDGGEWVPVVSTLGADEVSEQSLLQDLADQQDATEAAVRIFHALQHPDDAQA